MEQYEKWNLIKTELQLAYKLIPADAKQSDFGYSEADFLEYIQNNELKLAMEELSGVVEDNELSDYQFWHHMVNAARLMGSKKESEYRMYIDGT